MIVELNPQLVEVESRYVEEFYKPKNAISGTMFTEGAKREESFLGILSNAYNKHQKVSFGPHDLWYVILTEIARTINASPNTYRSVFTKTPQKIEILVPTSDVTYLPIDLIFRELKKLVPVDVDLFVPKFSTHTNESYAACLGAFADAVQSYYSYGTYCCGIHSLEIRGTLQDWGMFISNIGELQSILGESLHAWLDGVKNRAIQIFNSLTGGDIEFYKTIFSSTKIGSGSELLIDGWFGKDFFIEGGGKFPKLNNFPNTQSKVPFKNVDTGREFYDIFGCFASTVEKGFRIPKYGSFTFEVGGKPIEESNTYKIITL